MIFICESNVGKDCAFRHRCYVSWRSFECYLYSVLQGLAHNSFFINLVFACVFACVKVQRDFRTKMYCWILLLATFVVKFQGAFSAAKPIENQESIRNNLIGYESDFIEGLAPPVLEAENYFRQKLAHFALETESPYVVELHRKYLIIKTAGLPPQIIKLNQTETEGIQKLSLSFVDLLNSSKLSSPASKDEGDAPEWSDLNPLITLTNTGISLQFFNISKAEPTATEISSGDRHIVWDFLTKYLRNIFEEKLKRLKLKEKYAEVFEAPSDQSDSFAFRNFLHLLWNIMKFSVNYAETAFEGWTTSQPPTAAPETERKNRPTTVTFFAYEELSPFHEFPSQEFQYRRKDIDSIFYGRGVI